MQVKGADTLVVMLLYDRGRHQWTMATACCRITSQELKELYQLSEVMNESASYSLPCEQGPQHAET